nr:hypothetical protein [Rhodococcus sp. BL-253-APC-6A1W]
MARGLARAGADIALWGRDTAKLGRAADELSGFGVRVTTRSVDVSDEHGWSTVSHPSSANSVGWTRWSSTPESVRHCRSSTSRRRSSTGK